MAEIIFNAEFVKTEYAGNSCKNIKKQINTDEMVDYYERKEACDYTVDENEADDTYQINSQDAFNYYDYRIGSTGGFNRGEQADGKISAKNIMALCVFFRKGICPEQ